jgi:hypothetical protein
MRTVGGHAVVLGASMAGLTHWHKDRSTTAQRANRSNQPEFHSNTRRKPRVITARLFRMRSSVLD